MGQISSVFGCAVILYIYITLYTYVYIIWTMSYVSTLGMSYVQVSVCGMCGILSVLRAGFSVRYVQF